jgi:hypothetical protein
MRSLFCVCLLFSGYFALVEGSLRLLDARNKDYGEVVTVFPLTVDVWDETSEALAKYRLVGAGHGSSSQLLTVGYYGSALRMYYTESDCAGQPLIPVDGLLLNTLIVGGPGCVRLR